MIHIALCDDEKVFRDYLKGIIESVSTPDLIEFDEFSSGKKFLEAFESGMRYDIVFMDIQIRGMDGNETATRLRELDNDVILVFCSGTQLTVPPEMIRLTLPYCYLTKLKDRQFFIDEITKVIVECRTRMSRKSSYIVMNCCDYGDKRIYLSNVLYFANEKRVIRRKAFARCVNVQEPLYVEEPLKTIYEMVAEKGFEFCHNTYLVNLFHVERASVKQSMAELSNGEILNISRSRSKLFVERFGNYVGGINI